MKYMLNFGLISDSYFPEASVFVMLVLILILNPLLKVFTKGKWFIDRRQLALIFGILLMAATVPTQGLLRGFPYSLAKTTQESARNAKLAELHQEMDLPPSLFPDKITYGEDTPNASYLLDELPEGASIPWSAWIPVVISWGTLFVAMWMLMIGFGMIVYPQWRNNERLPFPILTLQQSLIGDITSEKRIPGIFKDKLFWVGAGIVFAIYAFRGLNAFTHNAWPSFPLGWQLRNAFSEEPWKHLPGEIVGVGKLYFMLIGVAYFMPNRVSFSIWFFTIAYGVYRMLMVSYAPPFDGSIVSNHSHGATLAVAIMVIFTGRHHWAKVGRDMVRPISTDEERCNRRAGWLFTLGWVGMMVWLIWVGIPPLWAFGLVFICFISALVIARIVAETGMPFVRITSIQPAWFVGLFPPGLATAAVIYMAGFLSIFFTQGSRISPAAMMPHVMGMDPDNGAKEQRRLPSLLIPVLVLGLLVAGATYLAFGYNNYASLDGNYRTGSHWGANQLSSTQNSMLAHARDAKDMISGKDAGQVATGAVIAFGLTIACLSSAAWPLHPVGLVMLGGFYARVGWASVFVGWCLKILVLRYGGASLYKRLKSLFIGIILGELFAAVLWITVPVVQMLLGADLESIGSTRILPP